VSQDFKLRIIEQMRNVPAASGEEVIDADDITVSSQQRFTEVRTEESRAAGHQNPLIEVVIFHRFFILRKIERACYLFQLMKTNQKLILASTSPRRADLLRSAGIEFCTTAPDADEARHPGETPMAYAVRTAAEKAQSISPPAGAVVIGADTVVSLEGRILGKPADRQDAEAMLRRLSGTLHEVITGVCLHSTGKTIPFHTATAVLFRALSEEEIRRYVQSDEPLDKAGAYAIQGGAAGMVRRIDGSYSNVIGLPLCELIEQLEEF
jgi:septum formation protein